MVSIVNRSPKVLGILEILDAYIDHYKDIIIKRTTFELKTYEKEFNIVSGLMKAISILDEVIKVIRGSKNKADAKENLVNKFDFNIEQAEAIVTLQLYRLTNTDIVVLKERVEELQKLIERCHEILSDEGVLKSLMKSELREVKKNYAVPRKTEIKDEITEIKVDLKDMIPKEDVIVVVTNDGYIKKVPMKSFKAATDETTLKPGDFVRNMFELNTRDYILSFTSLGNYLFIPVHTITECKWKDLGKHISNLIMIKENERIINSFIFEKGTSLVLTSKEGMIKKVRMEEFEVSRCSKPMTAIKLKDNDELISVQKEGKKTLILTDNNYYLLFETGEIPEVGPKASGVKGYPIKDNNVISSSQINDSDEYINIFTNLNTAKRVKLSELVELTRNKKGKEIIKKNKTKDYRVISAFTSNVRTINVIKTNDDVNEIKNSDIPIMDSNSFGSTYTKLKVVNVKPKYEFEKIGKIKEIDFPKEESKEETQISFEDFTNSFKI